MNGLINPSFSILHSKLRRKQCLHPCTRIFFVDSIVSYKLALRAKLCTLIVQAAYIRFINQELGLFLHLFISPIKVFLQTVENSPSILFLYHLFVLTIIYKEANRFPQVLSYKYNLNQMPPKKKQEQIDLATLPECRSLNAIVLIKGRKARALALQQKIQKQCEKWTDRPKRNEVIEHAKEKGLYVDPNTLTDKQKKDAKFMESVSTQFTPSVMAKAVQSLMAAVNLKWRIDRKTNPEKPEEKNGRKFELLHCFEDFPQTIEQFEELAAIGQNVRYVLVLQPKISWANAPELPQQGEEEEDDDVKEYKALLKKQEKIQEDIDYETKIQKRIQQIRNLRRSSDPKSNFRNTTIYPIQVQIDPFSEEASINEAIKLFGQAINKLNLQSQQFQQWRKDKVAGDLGPAVEVDHRKPEGKTVISLLDSLARSLDQQEHSNLRQDDQSDEMLQLINGFSAKPSLKVQKNEEQKKQGEQKPFLSANDWRDRSQLADQIRTILKFPGVNRHLMPEVPSKSEKIRKLLKSQSSLFLGKHLSLEEFQRRLQVLNFEEFIKEFDEQRSYSFSDRTYQEHHEAESLKRELYKALQFEEWGCFTKYDEESDQLYLMLVYKNNPRRVSKRVWESSWKVLPNFQSWLNYFKNNETNLANTQYFDIDYERIGNIQQNCKVFTLKNGQDAVVVVSKDCTASNHSQSLLYAIKDNFLFGIQNGKFYSQNGQVKVYHLRNTVSNQFETAILLPSCVIRLFSDGTVLIEKGSNRRLVTPQGYSIIYGENGNVVLHPIGGVTYSQESYINQLGYGLKDGRLFTSHTLKRKVEKAQIIKREDSTVIINKSEDNQQPPSKWIRFFEGSEYQVEGDRVRIEKEGEPFIACQQGNIRVVADEIIVRITSRPSGYTSVIQFEDGNLLRINKQNLYVFELDHSQQIRLNLSSNEISSNFNNEQVKITPGKAQYLKDGLPRDALEEEQKFSEEELLPQDYKQPRLFVINNDNTGFELLSEKMVRNYLKQHSNSVDKVYESPKGPFTEVHIVGKQNRKNGKFLKNELAVQLDVFDNTKEKPREMSYEHISLRTLLKYEPLSPDNITEVIKIKNEVESWRKQNAKDENDFGSKERDENATKHRIQSKLMVIRKRQEKQQKVNCNRLRETAKSFHFTTYEEIQRQLLKEQKEQQLRTQFLKMKNSIVRQYRKVEVGREGRRTEQSQNVEMFMDHYFLTHEGRRGLSQMPQWVFRPKQQKPPLELDPEIKKELGNTINRPEEESEDPKQRYDTVEVNLQPKREKEIFIKPSVFTQREIDEQRIAFQEEKKSYKYHEIKRKDFNVYGRQRRSKPQVPTLLRTQPMSQINQKYLVTEAPLDKKVKISSMKNKLTSSASGMTEMRKQGPHTLLMRTIDKGNDINRLLERRTMMVQADLNDKLQRDILINPVEANFGTLLENKIYEFKIEIKNEDVISQRITLKRPKSIYARVQLSQMGPIAMGMTRKITVTLRTSPELLGRFSDEFDIVTKHEIYHIPILAVIVGESQTRSEHLQRGVVEVEEGRKKNESSFQLPRLK